MTLRLLFMTLLVMSVLLGCAAAQEPADARLDQTAPRIALLLFENGSNDVAAPQKVRAALFQEMTARNYRLLPLERIDDSLRRVDVTLGTQLRLFDDRRALLYELVPAEIHCYGTVVEFGFTNALALTQRKVELKLRLVDAKTGAVLFEGQELGITTRGGLEAAADATIHTAGKIAKSVKESVKQLLPGETSKQAADLTDAVADVDMTQETYEAIRKLLTQFPKHLSSQ